jgi:general L-amino acid transport system permease protein
VSDFVRPKELGLRERLARDYFSTPLNALVTLATTAAVFWILWIVIHWGVINAVWFTDAEGCRGAKGACWSIITTRWRLILFGLYPFDEQWRSGLASVIVIAVMVLVCLPRNWSALRMSGILFGGFVLFLLLMRGGFLGLSYVPSSLWGGLALTLFIYITVITFGLPVAVLLALGRQSKLPVLRGIVSFMIDVTRSLPLVTILFSAALILPLVLPDFLQGERLTRILVAFAFFFGCYQSENIRAGMQALPIGQTEAAEALGLNYFQRMRMIILPQAFRLSMPATINQFVITFKETSLVVIIGLYDLMASSRAAYRSGEWLPYHKEAYFFVAMIFFLGAFSLSRYGAYLERRMGIRER